MAVSILSGGGEIWQSQKLSGPLSTNQWWHSAEIVLSALALNHFSFPHDGRIVKAVVTDRLKTFSDVMN